MAAMQPAAPLQFLNLMSPSGPCLSQPQRTPAHQEKVAKPHPQTHSGSCPPKEPAALLSQQVPRLRAMVESQAFKNILVDEMDMMVSRAATVIQANWKGYRLRQKLISQMTAAKAIQEAWRRFSTRRLMHYNKLTAKKAKREEEGDIPYHPPQQVRFHALEDQPPVMVNKETQFPSSDNLVPSHTTAAPGPCVGGVHRGALLPQQSVAGRLTDPNYLPCMLTKTVRSSCLIRHMEEDSVKSRPVASKTVKLGIPESAASGRCVQGSLKTQTPVHNEADVPKATPHMCLVNKTPTKVCPVASAPKSPATVVTAPKSKLQTCPTSPPMVMKMQSVTSPTSPVTRPLAHVRPNPSLSSTTPHIRSVVPMARVQPPGCAVNSTIKALPRLGVPISKGPLQTGPGPMMAKTSPQMRPMTRSQPQTCAAFTSSKTSSQSGPTAKPSPQTRLAAMITKTPAQIRSVAAVLKTLCLVPTVAASSPRGSPQTPVVAGIPNATSQVHLNSPKAKVTVSTKQTTGVVKVASQSHLSEGKGRCGPHGHLDAVAPQLPAQSPLEIEKMKPGPPRVTKKEAPPKTDGTIVTRALSWTKVTEDGSKPLTQIQQKAKVVKVHSRVYMPEEMTVTLSQAQLAVPLTKASSQGQPPPGHPRPRPASPLSKAVLQSRPISGLATGLPEGRHPPVGPSATLPSSPLAAHLMSLAAQLQPASEQTKSVSRAHPATSCPATASPQARSLGMAFVPPEGYPNTCPLVPTCPNRMASHPMKSSLQLRPPAEHAKTTNTKTTKAMCHVCPPTKHSKAPSLAQLITCLAKVPSQAHLSTGLAKAQSQAQLASETAKCFLAAHPATDLSSETQSQPLLNMTKGSVQLRQHSGTLNTGPHVKPNDRGVTQPQLHSHAQNKATQNPRSVATDTQDMLVPLLTPTGHPVCNGEFWGDSGRTQTPPPPPVPSQAGSCHEDLAASIASLCADLVAMLGSPEDLRTLLAKTLSQGEVRTALSQALSREVLGPSVVKALPQGMLGMALMKALSWSELGISLSRALSRGELRPELSKATQGKLAEVLCKALTEDERATLSQALCQGELGAVFTQSLAQMAQRTGAILPKATSKMVGSRMTAVPAPVEVTCSGKLSVAWGPALSPEQEQEQCSKVRPPWKGLPWAQPGGVLLGKGDGATWEGSPCSPKSPTDSFSGGMVTNTYQCPLLIVPTLSWERGSGLCSGLYLKPLDLDPMACGEGPHVPKRSSQQPPPCPWQPLVANGAGPSSNQPSVTSSTAPSSRQQPVASRVSYPWSSYREGKMEASKHSSGTGGGKYPMSQRPTACQCPNLGTHKMFPCAHCSSIVKSRSPSPKRTVRQVLPSSHRLVSSLGNKKMVTVVRDIVVDEQHGGHSSPVYLNPKQLKVSSTSTPKQKGHPQGSLTPSHPRGQAPGHRTSLLDELLATFPQHPQVVLAKSYPRGSVVHYQNSDSHSSVQSDTSASTSAPSSLTPSDVLEGCSSLTPSEVLEGCREGDLQDSQPVLKESREVRHRPQGQLESTWPAGSQHTVPQFQPPPLELGPLLLHSTSLALNVHWESDSGSDYSTGDLTEGLSPDTTAPWYRRSHQVHAGDLQPNEVTQLDPTLPQDILADRRAPSPGQVPEASEGSPCLSQPLEATGLCPISSQSTGSSTMSPSLAQPSIDTGVAPSPAQPSMDTGVAPSPAQPSMDTGVAPSPAEPSMDTGVAPSPAQPSMDTGVAPSPAQPSMDTGVAPSPAQPSMDTGVAPSPAQPSMDTGVAPSPAQPSMDTGVAPSPAQPSMDTGVAPSPAQPSMDTGVAPSPAQPSMDTGVAPSPAQPSMDTGVAPSPAQPSMDTGVAPSPAQPSMDTGVAPSPAQPSMDTEVSPTLTEPLMYYGLPTNFSQPFLYYRGSSIYTQQHMASGVSSNFTQTSGTSVVALGSQAVSTGVASSQPQLCATTHIAPRATQSPVNTWPPPGSSSVPRHGAGHPDSVQTSVATEVSPNFFQPFMPYSMPSNFTQPCMATIVPPNFVQPSMSHSMSPSLAQPFVVSVMSPTLAHASVANRAPPNLSQPTTASGVAPGVFQVPLTNSLSSPLMARRVCSNLAQASVATLGALSLLPPTVVCGVGLRSSKPALGLQHTHKDSSTAQSQPSMLNLDGSYPYVMSRLGQPSLGVCGSLGDNLMIDTMNQPNPQDPTVYSELTQASKRPPGPGAQSMAPAEGGGLALGASVPCQTWLRGIAPGTPQGPGATRLFLSMCQGDNPPPMAAWALPADVPWTQEQAVLTTGVGQGPCPAVMPSMQVPSEFFPNQLGTSFPQTCAPFPVTLDPQLLSMATVVPLSCRYAGIVIPDAAVGAVGEGLAQDSVDGKVPSALVPKPVVESKNLNLPQGSVIRGVGKSVPPESMVDGVAQSVPPESMVDGMAQSVPPESMVDGIAQSVPPESMVDGMAQSVPPESMVDGVAQSVPPESMVDGVAQSVPPESMVDGVAQSVTPESTVGVKAQNLPPESVVSGEIQSPCQDSVASDLALRLPPCSVASSVAPSHLQEMDGDGEELNPAVESLPSSHSLGPSLGFVASGTGPRVPLGSVASSVGSMLVGISPRPYQGAQSGEHSRVSSLALHVTRLASAHSPAPAVQRVSQDQQHLPTGLSSTLQFSKDPGLTKLVGVDNPTLLKPTQMDDTVSSTLESGIDPVKSEGLEIISWMGLGAAGGQSHEHETLAAESILKDQVALLVAEAPSQASSVTPVPVQAPSLGQHPTANSITPVQPLSSESNSAPPRLCPASRTLSLQEAPVADSSSQPPASNAVTVPSRLNPSIDGTAKLPPGSEVSTGNLNILQRSGGTDSAPLTKNRASSVSQMGEPQNHTKSNYREFLTAKKSYRSIHGSLVSELPEVSMGRLLPFSNTLEKISQVSSDSHKQSSGTARVGVTSLIHLEDGRGQKAPSGVQKVSLAFESSPNGSQRPLLDEAVHDTGHTGQPNPALVLTTHPGQRPPFVTGPGVSYDGSSLVPTTAHGQNVQYVTSPETGYDRASRIPTAPYSHKHQHVTVPKTSFDKGPQRVPTMLYGHRLQYITMPKTSLDGSSRVPATPHGQKLHHVTGLKTGFGRVSQVYTKPHGHKPHLVTHPKTGHNKISPPPTVPQGPVDAGPAAGQSWNSKVPNVSVRATAHAGAPQGTWHPSRGHRPWDPSGAETTLDHKPSAELMVSVSVMEKAIGQAIVTIQACARGYLVRRAVKVWHQWATVIQATWRGYRVRRNLARLLRATTIIQAAWRGYCTRRDRAHQVLFPTLWPEHSGRAHRNSDTRNSSEYRSEHRCFLSCQPDVCSVCQSLGSRVKNPPNVVMLVGSQPRTCHVCGHTLSTRVVQGFGQGTSGQSGSHWALVPQQHPLLSRQHRAATLIQAAWKGYRTRCQISQQQSAAKMVQAMWRGHYTRSCLTTDALLGTGGPWTISRGTPPRSSGAYSLHWPGV